MIQTQSLMPICSKPQVESALFFMTRINPKQKPDQKAVQERHEEELQPTEIEQPMPSTGQQANEEPEQNAFKHGQNITAILHERNQQNQDHQRKGTCSHDRSPTRPPVDCRMGEGAHRSSRRLRLIRCHGQRQDLLPKLALWCLTKSPNRPGQLQAYPQY